MDLDFKLESMGIEEMKELIHNLIRLARVDAELIQTLQNIIELIEPKQGE